MTETQQLLIFAKSLAYEAGEVMRHYFDAAQMRVTTKADNSPVTEADTKINQLLIERVKHTFPEHAVLGEEASTATHEDTQVWVCDPIDGTAPFIFGLPTGMFSLAFVKHGEPIVAVAFDPFLERLFWAVKGQGAFCNDKPLHVAPQGLKEAHIAGPSYIKGILQARTLYEGLEEKGARIEIFPGNVYKCCLIAEGRLHGRIFSGPGAHDIAAVKLIVEEAGGKVTDLDGNEQRYDRPIKGAIISNGVIHDDLLAAVRAFGGAQEFMEQQKP
ncbi:MAG TPA: inositol monophosphatase [Candidatus Saccharimonadales bacterium]|nr:inositol monophosphatase [Candidatus Saccharimonadales bacterium]